MLYKHVVKDNSSPEEFIALIDSKWKAARETVAGSSEAAFQGHTAEEQEV